MAKVLVHCPLNISRTLEEMLQNHSQQMREKFGLTVDIETQPHRPTEEGLLEMYMARHEIPDLVVGHVNDFAELPEDYLYEYFRALPGRFPLRRELAETGFSDRRGYFHPFVIIPFAIFYNQNQLAEKDLPRIWEDLLDPRWQGQIHMPDEYRMVSKIIRAFMEAHYPDRFNDFQQNVFHQGAPIDVVNAVDEGRYPVGITNVAFARISRHKNTRLLWPQDGIFCMPQVMVWSKQADERLLEIGDFLMSQPVQEYLALQAFIPASPEVAIPQLLTDNNVTLRWQGWENYLQVVKGAKA